MNPTFKQVTKTRYVQLVAELAQEIFVQHYTKLTPRSPPPWPISTRATS